MSYYLSILFYCSLPFIVFFIDFLINFIFSLFSKKECKFNLSNKIFTSNFLSVFFISLFLAVVVGFRSSSESFHVGNDTYIYRSFYDSLSGLSLSEAFSLSNQFEKGFVLYCFLFSALKINYYVFSFITYFFIYLVITIFAYNFSRFPSLTLSLFICFGIFTLNMSTLRQSIAISLCLLSLFLFAKKGFLFKILSVIPFVVSIFFHKSSIFFIIIPFLSLFSLKKRIHSIYLVIFFISSIIVFIPIAHFLFMNFSSTVKIYSFYPIAFVPSFFGGTEILLLVLIFLFLLYKCFCWPKPFDLSFSRIPLEKINIYVTQNQKLSNKLYNVELSLMLFQAFLCICDGYMFLLSRIAVIGSIGICLFVPNYLFDLSKRKPHFLLMLLTILFACLYFYFTTLKSNYLNLLPYGVF